MDTPIRGQPPYIQWTNCLSPAINCPYISTSDEGNLQTMACPHCVHYSEVPLYRSLLLLIAGCETIH